MSANPKTKSLRWFLLGMAATIVSAIAVIVITLPPCIFSLVYETKTTVLLVRHAEKDRSIPDNRDNGDGTFGPPLCDPFGIERAQELAHVAGDAGVNVIYHTQFLRTRRTIEPLDAVVTGNSTQEFAADDVDGLVRDILDHHRGETVFVAGHSDTVPSIIQGLGGPRPPDIADDDFDNLYVVTVTCSCGTRVTRLEYGRTSPLSAEEAEQCR